MRQGRSGAAPAAVPVLSQLRQGDCSQAPQSLGSDAQPMRSDASLADHFGYGGDAEDRRSCARADDGSTASSRAAGPRRGRRYSDGHATRARQRRRRASTAWSEAAPSCATNGPEAGLDVAQPAEAPTAGFLTASQDAPAEVLGVAPEADGHARFDTCSTGGRSLILNNCVPQRIPPKAPDGLLRTGSCGSAPQRTPWDSKSEESTFCHSTGAKTVAQMAVPPPPPPAIRAVPPLGGGPVSGRDVVLASCQRAHPTTARGPMEQQDATQAVSAAPLEGGQSMSTDWFEWSLGPPRAVETDGPESDRRLSNCGNDAGKPYSAEAMAMTDSILLAIFIDALIPALSEVSPRLSEEVKECLFGHQRFARTNLDAEIPQTAVPPPPQAAVPPPPPGRMATSPPLDPIRAGEPAEAQGVPCSADACGDNESSRLSAIAESAGLAPAAGRGPGVRLSRQQLLLKVAPPRQLLDTCGALEFTSEALVKEERRSKKLSELVQTQAKKLGVLQEVVDRQTQQLTLLAQQVTDFKSEIDDAASLDLEGKVVTLEKRLQEMEAQNLSMEEQLLEAESRATQFFDLRCALQQLHRGYEEQMAEVSRLQQLLKAAGVSTAAAVPNSTSSDGTTDIIMSGTQQYQWYEAGPSNTSEQAPLDTVEPSVPPLPPANGNPSSSEASIGPIQSTPATVVRQQSSESPVVGPTHKFLHHDIFLSPVPHESSQDETETSPERSAPLVSLEFQLANSVKTAQPADPDTLCRVVSSSSPSSSPASLASFPSSGHAPPGGCATGPLVEGSCAERESLGAHQRRQSNPMQLVHVETCGDPQPLGLPNIRSPESLSVQNMRADASGGLLLESVASIPHKTHETGCVAILSTETVEASSGTHGVPLSVVHAVAEPRVAPTDAPTAPDVGPRPFKCPSPSGQRPPPVEVDPFSGNLEVSSMFTQAEIQQLEEELLDARTQVQEYQSTLNALERRTGREISDLRSLARKDRHDRLQIEQECQRLLSKFLELQQLVMVLAPNAEVDLLETQGSSEDLS